MSDYRIILLVLCCALRGLCQSDSASDTSEYIILATDRNISRLQIPSGDKTVSSIGDLTFPHSLEYDAKHDCVFWADYTRIVRQCLGDNAITVLVSSGVDKIEDLAYDWLSETLYYVDSDRISAIDTSARARAAADGRGHHYWSRTIVRLGTTISTTGLAVHPERGYLFWTQSVADVNSTSAQLATGIYRAKLDGSDERALISGPHVVHPVKISVDYVTDRLYWIDTQTRGGNYVGGCGLHGDKFTRHFSLDLEDGPAHFLLSVYNDVVYWLDGLQNIRASDVRYLDEHGETVQSVVIAGNQEVVRDFKVYYRGAQLGTSSCTNGRHNCTHLCVGAPNQGYGCLCPDALTRTADGRCQCEWGADEECSKRLHAEHCADAFRCDGQVCLPVKYHCDGTLNCLDGADEGDCELADPAESYYILSLIGLVVVLLILVLVAIFLWRRCRNRRQSQPENPNAAYY